VPHAPGPAIPALAGREPGRLALDAARSREPNVRRHGIRIIGAFGYHAGFEPLRVAVDDADRRMAELAIAGMGSIDDPRVDNLLAQLAGASDEVLRAAVMRAAAQRGGPEAVKLLVRGLADSGDWVRYYAAQGFGRLGPDATADASRILVERLRDPAPQVRIAAIEALSRIGSAEAWDAVRKAASSTDPDERRAGLVGVGMHAREGASDILIDAAASDDQATRLVALAGLARLSEPRALATLSAAIADSSPEVRTAAVSLLAERDDEVAARVLVEWALRSDGNHPVQRALSRAGASRVLAILAHLPKADAQGAPVLVAALARMKFEMATVALFEALELPNPTVRSQAAAALVALGARGAVHAVANLAANDPDPEVRRICAAAIAS